MALRSYAAPERPALVVGPELFLAGSIEMGRASEWQARLIAELAAQGVNGTVWNPRRPDWDASLRQDIDEPVFREQVEWELEHLEAADVVVVVFDPTTQSPITLLELGWLAACKPHAVVVYCPEGFWRRGNVQVVTYRYGLQWVEGWDALVAELVCRMSAVLPPKGQ